MGFSKRWKAVRALAAVLMTGVCVLGTGCPVCARVPELVGEWTFTRPGPAPIAYTLRLDGDGRYELVEVSCDFGCDSETVTSMESGTWEACYSSSYGPTVGTLKIQTEGEAGAFSFIWSSRMPYRNTELDRLTIVTSWVGDEQAETEFEWMRVQAN